MIRKVIKIALILLIVLIILLAIIVTIVLLKIKDKTDDTSVLIKENNVSFEDALSKDLTYAMSDTKDTGVIDIKLSEYDLNEMLYGLVQMFNFSGPFKIKSGYVKLTDDEYKIYFPATIFGISTLLNGNIKLLEEDHVLHISIRNLQAGNVNLKSGLVKNILSIFGLKKKVINLLESYGVTTTFSADYLDLSISRYNLKELLNIVLDGNEFRSLVYSLYDIFVLENECIILNINNPLDLNIKLDFSMFNGVKDLSYENVKNKTKDLLLTKKVGVNTSSIISTYYLSGYPYLSDIGKGKTEEVFSQIYNDESYKLYTGMIPRTNINMNELMKDKILLTLTEGLVLTDNELNNVFSRFSILGSGISFASYENYDVSYIFVSSFETKISDDYLNIYVDININGYVISLDFGFIMPEAQAVSIEGTIDYIKLGDVLINDEDTHNIFGFLLDNLSLESWIKGDKETNTIILDFKSFYEGNAVFNKLLSGASKVKTKLYVNNYNTEHGYIKIKIVGE